MDMTFQAVQTKHTELGKLPKTPVEIKGYRGTLSLLLDQTEQFETILYELESILKNLGNRQFFQGSRNYFAIQ